MPSATIPQPPSGTIVDEPPSSIPPPPSGNIVESDPVEPEERDFLAKHPDHQYMPADPKFPNRPAGIYPTGPGNEWRQHPDYAQSPVDIHQTEHTLEGAAAGATAVAPAVLPSAVAAGAGALAPALTRGVVGVTAWAAAHPVAAKVIWEGLKVAIMGTAAGTAARIAGKAIKASPED